MPQPLRYGLLLAALVVAREGDLFYWPAGHTAVVEEDTKLVEFSPEGEFREVMEHIGRKMAEAGQ